jgi:predicted nucleic acid-binding protein
MKATFADAFYFLALLNPKDKAHPAAVAAEAGMSGKLITTEHVLNEVGDALAHPVDRPSFLALLRTLANDTQVEIIPHSAELFAAGVAFFSQRMDKGWSLTDCISFHIMRERGVREALTGDVHYRQAGFTALLVPAP